MLVVRGDDRVRRARVAAGQRVHELRVARPQVALQILHPAQVLHRAHPGLDAQAVQEVGEVGVAEQGAQLAPEAQVVADEDVQVAGRRGALGLLTAAADPGEGGEGARIVGLRHASGEETRNIPSVTRLRASIMPR